MVKEELLLVLTTSMEEPMVVLTLLSLEIAHHGDLLNMKCGLWMTVNPTMVISIYMV